VSELDRAFDRLPVSHRPAYIQAVRSISGDDVHRPNWRSLQHSGIPKPARTRTVWALDAATGPLHAAVVATDRACALSTRRGGPRGGRAGYADFVRAHTRCTPAYGIPADGNASAAEELVQDTLVRLYPKWGRVQAAEYRWPTCAGQVANAFVNRAAPAGEP